MNDERGNDGTMERWNDGTMNVRGFVLSGFPSVSKSQVFFSHDPTNLSVGTTLNVHLGTLNGILGFAALVGHFFGCWDSRNMTGICTQPHAADHHSLNELQHRHLIIAIAIAIAIVIARELDLWVANISV